MKKGIINNWNLNLVIKHNKAFFFPKRWPREYYWKMHQPKKVQVTSSRSIGKKSIVRQLFLANNTREYIK